MARRPPFTVAEVELLIPTLERIFTHVLQLRAALRIQEQRLERAGVKLSREVLDEDDAKDTPEARHAKALFRGCYEALSETLTEVTTLGGEVKDVEIGLVDFPGKRGTEDILLCWRFGEKRIGFWHTVDGGYANRRPIDDQVPRQPPRLD